MVSIIGGAIGTGKTGKLIDLANEDVKTNKGIQIYIDAKKDPRQDLDRSIRYINAKEFAVNSSQMFFGFLCGIISGNYDITKIYIDNIHELIGVKCVETIGAFIDQLEEFTKEYDFDIVLTMTVSDEEQSEYLKKYNVQMA